MEVKHRLRDYLYLGRLHLTEPKPRVYRFTLVVCDVVRL